MASYIKQHTIKKPISCCGIGLHSGKNIHLTLKPAEVGTGVVFVRVDGSSHHYISAKWDQVTDTKLCTKISNAQNISVATIEHLMAALAAYEIDNMIIEIDGPEVPIMDGSAAPFLFLLECVGKQAQSAPREYIEVTKIIGFQDQDAYLTLSPANQFSLDIKIEYPNTYINTQDYQHNMELKEFKKDIASARTFGFYHEINYLWQNGLALGGSMENAVVINGHKIMNPEGLRYHDECVRHKVLDTVGDLYLAGHPILGLCRGFKNGHRINNAFLRHLMVETDAWQKIYLEESKPAIAQSFVNKRKHYNQAEYPATAVAS